MTDRQPTRPGRVLITPEDGGAPFYGTIKMADEPYEGFEGTEWLKKNVLPDDISAAIGLNPANNPLPKDAFALLANKVTKNGELQINLNAEMLQGMTVSAGLTGANYIPYVDSAGNVSVGDRISFFSEATLSQNPRSSFLMDENGHMQYVNQGKYITFVWMGATDAHPVADNAIDIGAPTKRIKQMYSATSPIITSNKHQKKDISKLDKIKDFFMALNPVKYRYKDGTSGRIHHGLIAQEILEAMLANGLTDMDFAGFIKSPVYKEETRVVGQRKIVVPAVWNNDRTEILEPEHVEMVDVIEEIPVEEREIIDHTYGLRYSEFIPMLIEMVQDQQKTLDAQQKQIDDLTARMKRLEEK